MRDVNIGLLRDCGWYIDSIRLGALHNNEGTCVIRCVDAPEIRLAVYFKLVDGEPEATDLKLFSGAYQVTNLLGDPMSHGAAAAALRDIPPKCWWAKEVLMHLAA